MNSTLDVDATYFGFIGSTYDALILFEACIAGKINPISRRPHELERERVIRSGNIFIYEENTSGIKRWTDGVSWSPSRILGNFLIYRQLTKAFGPGEKKKAIKKSKAAPYSITRDNNSNGRNRENISGGVHNVQVAGGNYSYIGTVKLEAERALIGSLTDSYDFLQDGLVKKTISVNYGEATHHLVSYYTISDALSQTFIVPSKDPSFACIYPRASLLSSQNFRNSIDDVDPLNRTTYPRHRHETAKQALIKCEAPTLSAPRNCFSRDESLKMWFSSKSNPPSILAALEDGLPAYGSTFGYANQHFAEVGDLQPSRRLEHYQGNYKQHFILAGSSNPDESSASMPTGRCPQQNTTYFHRRDSEDSDISMTMNMAISNPNFTHSQNSLHELPRDFFLKTACMDLQKTTPNSHQMEFANQISYQKSVLNGEDLRITASLGHVELWQAGNTGVGHGHYHNI